MYWSLFTFEAAGHDADTRQLFPQRVLAHDRPSYCLLLVKKTVLSLTTRLQPKLFGAGPIISQENVTARNSPRISPCRRKVQPCVRKQQESSRRVKWPVTVRWWSCSTEDHNVFLTLFHEDTYWSACWKPGGKCCADDNNLYQGESTECL